MKEIIIKAENSEKIMEVFHRVQGKSSARVITCLRQLELIIESAERRIGTMAANAKEGSLIIYDFGQHFPRAYKYTPDSTHFVLRFHSGTWRLQVDSVTRMPCPERGGWEYKMELSETAKAAILKRYE